MRTTGCAAAVLSVLATFAMLSCPAAARRGFGAAARASGAVARASGSAARAYGAGARASGAAVTNALVTSGDLDAGPEIRLRPLEKRGVEATVHMFKAFKQVADRAVMPMRSAPPKLRKLGTINRNNQPPPHLTGPGAGKLRTLPPVHRNRPLESIVLKPLTPEELAKLTPGERQLRLIASQSQKPPPIPPKVMKVNFDDFVPSGSSTAAREQPVNPLLAGKRFGSRKRPELDQSGA